MSGCSRQQLYVERQRNGLVVLPVEVALVRTVEWLLAAGLLLPEDQDDRQKVAQALWQAALHSIEEYELTL
jgi:hypothetical protein